MVERLSAEELAALGARERGIAINEVIAESWHLLRVKNDVLAKLAAAKIDILRCDGEDLIDAKQRKIEAELQLAYCVGRAQTIKSSSSLLQSLLRGADIV